MMTDRRTRRERREEHGDAVQREEAVDAGVREVGGSVQILVEGRAHQLDAEPEVGPDDHALELQRRVALLVVVRRRPRVAGLAVEEVAVACGRGRAASAPSRRWRTGSARQTRAGSREDSDALLGLWGVGHR